MTERDIDDVKDFQHLENAMNSVGIDNNKKMDIFRIVAAVLHLGNIKFQESTKDKKGIRFVLISPWIIHQIMLGSIRLYMPVFRATCTFLVIFM